jgi:hypothetical protein
MEDENYLALLYDSFWISKRLFGTDPQSGSDQRDFLSELKTPELEFRSVGQGTAA